TSDTGAQGARHGLYAAPAEVGYRYAVGAPPAGAVLVVPGPALADDPSANAALGVDAHGFVVYAERQPRATLSLAEALRRAGVTRAIALPDDVRLALVADGQSASPDEFSRPLDPALAL